MELRLRLLHDEVNPDGAVRLDVAVLPGNAGSVQQERVEHLRVVADVPQGFVLEKKPRKRHIANTVPVILTDEKQVKRFAEKVISASEKVKQWFEKLLKDLHAILDKAYNALKREKSWEQMELIRKNKQALELISDYYFEGMEGMKGTNGGRISSNGFNGYTSHQKENWVNSKRIVIYDSAGQLSGFVEDAITGKNLGNKLYFGTVSKAVCERIYNATGLDVEGYNCSLAADEVRKILKDHGDEKNEDKRGQRAITKEDFALIPDVVNNADKVVLSTRKYNNRPVINFVKDINGRITVTAYVSQRHIDLTVQTMFSGKKRSLATATDEHASVNTLKAANGTASIDTMPQTSEDVKFSRKDDVSVTAKDVQKLQKENDKLTQALDLVRQELKITQGHHVKPAVIDRLAGRILKDYQSTMPKTELVESITQLFDYIGNGERVIWDEVQAGAMNIALNVLDKSTQRNTEWYDATKPARDYLKNTAKAY